MVPCGLHLLFPISIFIFQNQISSAASDLYVKPGQDVTIPCMLNIAVSNIEALYWQKITNSTPGSETLYAYHMFSTDLGWQSPLKGYVVNSTDLVLLNVSFAHDGVYICKISLHNEPRIVEKETSLYVIWPLVEIKMRDGTSNTTINDGDVIQLPRNEEIDVECAIHDDIRHPVTLQWVAPVHYKQANATNTKYRGPYRVITLNTSSLQQDENVTCEAVQWIGGNPYKTIESTFTFKRLRPRINIANCTAQVDSQPGDCCHLNESAHPLQAKDLTSSLNIKCEAVDVGRPVNMTLFHYMENDLKVIETVVGFSVSATPDPADNSNRWICSIKTASGESLNKSACLYPSRNKGEAYNIHTRSKWILATAMSTCLLIITFIIFIIYKKRGRNGIKEQNEENHVYHSIASLVSEDENFPDPPRVTCELDQNHANPTPGRCVNCELDQNRVNTTPGACVNYESVDPDETVGSDVSSFEIDPSSDRDSDPHLYTNCISRDADNDVSDETRAKYFEVMDDFTRRNEES